LLVELSRGTAIGGKVTAVVVVAHLARPTSATTAMKAIDRR